MYLSGQDWQSGGGEASWDRLLITTEDSIEEKLWATRETRERERRDDLRRLYQISTCCVWSSGTGGGWTSPGGRDTEQRVFTRAGRESVSGCVCGRCWRWRYDKKTKMDGEESQLFAAIRPVQPFKWLHHTFNDTQSHSECRFTEIMFI